MLIKVNESEKPWYPIPINDLDDLLKKQIDQECDFKNIPALRKNISYNLQYLEYIHRCLEDLKLSSVIKTQNIKMFIIVGCSIIESLLTYLLIKNRNYLKLVGNKKQLCPVKKKILMVKYLK